MRWRVFGFGGFFPYEWSTPQESRVRALPKFDCLGIENENGPVSDQLRSGKVLMWWIVRRRPKHGKSCEKKAKALESDGPCRPRKPPSGGHAFRDPIDGQDALSHSRPTRRVFAGFLVEACESWSCLIFHDKKSQRV